MRYGIGLQIVAPWDGKKYTIVGHDGILYQIVETDNPRAKIRIVDEDWIDKCHAAKGNG